MPESQDSQGQSALAWTYSFFAGVFAFAFSLYFFSPASGPQFAALAAVCAFICARIAGWLASYSGNSGYGLVTCIITSFIFPLVPPLVAVTYMVRSETLTDATIAEYVVTFVLYYIFGIQYAAPAAFAATLIYNVALAVVRRTRWLAVQQRWL